MKKTLYSLLTAVIVSFGSLCAHGAEVTSQAIVRKVQGTVYVVIEGKTSTVMLGDKLPQGATIFTREDSLVDIETMNGTVSTIGTTSAVILEKLSVTTSGGAVTKQTTLLDLKVGRILANIDPANKKINDFGIRTPKGVAAARGTVPDVFVANPLLLAAMSRGFSPAVGSGGGGSPGSVGGSPGGGLSGPGGFRPGGVDPNFNPVPPSPGGGAFGSTGAGGSGSGGGGSGSGGGGSGSGGGGGGSSDLAGLAANLRSSSSPFNNAPVQVTIYVRSGSVQVIRGNQTIILTVGQVVKFNTTTQTFDPPYTPVGTEKAELDTGTSGPAKIIYDATPTTTGELPQEQTITPPGGGSNLPITISPIR